MNSLLSTALVCDACVRLRIPIRLAPAGIKAVIPGAALGGRARPVRHHGSVDVFLEAIDGAREGEVLVIDNGGRRDEGCIGDLIVLEAQSAGMGGIVLWGAHRDSVQVKALGLPVFSYDSWPAGPLEPRERDEATFASARFGEHMVTGADTVFADDDGVVFVPATQVPAIITTADEIARVEQSQISGVRSGRSLRRQLELGTYQQKRARDPSYTFRDHLRRTGRAIEE